MAIALVGETVHALRGKEAYYHVEWRRMNLQRDFNPLSRALMYT